MVLRLVSGELAIKARGNSSVGEFPFASPREWLELEADALALGGRLDRGVFGSLCNSTLSGMILGDDMTELRAGEGIASSNRDSSVTSDEDAARAVEGECENLEKDDRKRVW